MTAALFILLCVIATALFFDFTNGFHDTANAVASSIATGALKPKAAVRSAGVLVGRVESITFDDKSFQARVSIAMETRYGFPKDSSLKILTSGLLGEQYIGLEPGADTRNLAAGDTISSTQSAVVLENLISQFLFNKAADTSATQGNKDKK